MRPSFTSALARFLPIVVLLPALWPAAGLAAGGVTVKPSAVLAGQSVTVTGSGWAPNDQILVSFTDPATGSIIPLGVIAADAGGNFQRAIQVPPDVPPGTYEIDGNGLGGSVAVNFTVLAPSPTPAPPTPTPGPPTPTAEVAQPTGTPSPTATATATPTPTATATSTPTATPTATSTPTSTSTSTPTPTNTPTLPERIGQATGGLAILGLAVILTLVVMVVALVVLPRRRS